VQPLEPSLSPTDFLSFNKLQIFIITSKLKSAEGIEIKPYTERTFDKPPLTTFPVNTKWDDVRLSQMSKQLNTTNSLTVTPEKTRNGKLNGKEAPKTAVTPDKSRNSKLSAEEKWQTQQEKKLQINTMYKRLTINNKKKPTETKNVSNKKVSVALTPTKTPTKK